MARGKKRERRSFGRVRQERSGRWSASYLHRGTLHHAPATFESETHADAWLVNERDLIDLDGRKPGTWAPPADRAAKAAAAKLTFRDYAETWLKHRPLARLTRHNYRYHLDQNILPTLGDRALAEITPDDVRAWFASLGTEHETRNARAYGVVTAIFNSATDDDLIARSPARIRGASAVKRRRRSVVLIDPDELVALADKMPGRLKLAVLLAGWCGLRRGEVFALTRADIAADYSSVQINKGLTYRRGRYEVGPPKTRESNRTVSIPPHLVPIIEAHLREHVGTEPDALLFPDPKTGAFHTEGRFHRPFDAARKAIGRDGLRFHDLRHFGGVMAAVAGGTTKEVMDRLGHTTSSAAMRYQHVAAGRADALAERLSALASPGTPSSASG